MIFRSPFDTAIAVHRGHLLRQRAVERVSRADIDQGGSSTPATPQRLRPSSRGGVSSRCSSSVMASEALTITTLTLLTQTARATQDFWSDFVESHRSRPLGEAAPSLAMDAGGCFELSVALGVPGLAGE